MQRTSRPLCSALLAVAAAIAASTARAQPRPPTPPAVVAAVSENARDVIDRIRPSVIQIKGFFGTNTAHAFHGTGFAVADGGVFLTNYHVVSEHLNEPKRYRLEYLTAEGKSGALAVAAIDVRHDLAVVRATDFAPQPLRLVANVPRKGERAYAVGFPLDVGLTITEGVSNGKVADSFDPRIHYSGAINGGMSGGPALNAAGEVIGVNVSGYRFQQLVSFLVPAEHASALLARASAAKMDLKALRGQIGTQLAEHSSKLLGALDGPIKTLVSAGYALPTKLAPFLDCQASGNAAPTSPVRQERIRCSAKAGLYLERRLSSGDIRYTHYVMTTEKLDALRFTNRLSALTSARGNYGSKRHVGSFACEDRVVRLRGFDAGVLICVRGYRKLTGLYDVTARITSLDGTRRGFTSHLDMYGVPHDPAMRFLRRFIESMERRS